jgi:GT2 family glycosyltransferase
MGVLKEVNLTKNAYKHFRRVYPTAELCISVNNDDETGKWAQSIAKKDSNFKWCWTKSVIPFSENYNKAVALATNEKIVFYHNDMIPAPGFLERLDENTDPMTILGYTTVEPPIFKDHDRPGKIIKDFGKDFDEFKVEEFEEFCKGVEETVIDGTFFFLSCFKETFDKIGGFDEFTFNPVFCEDDDLILRFRHLGCNIQTTNTAVVYHFVSKTIRFSSVPIETWNHSSEETEANSARNFIRKWGGRYFGYLNNKVGVFDIGYRLTHATKDIVRVLEPFARNLQVDCKIDEYLLNEQPNTNFRLATKFTNELTNNVIVNIDCNRLNQTTFTHLTHLPVLLSILLETGNFNYSEFMVMVKEPSINLVDTLIKIERK